MDGQKAGYESLSFFYYYICIMEYTNEFLEKMIKL